MGLNGEEPEAFEDLLSPFASSVTEDHRVVLPSALGEGPFAATKVDEAAAEEVWPAEAEENEVEETAPQGDELEQQLEEEEYEDAEFKGGDLETLDEAAPLQERETFLGAVGTLLSPGAVVSRVRELLGEGLFGVSLLVRFASGRIWNEDYLGLEVLFHRQPRLRPADLDALRGPALLKRLHGLAVKHGRELTALREGVVRPVFGSPVNFRVPPAEGCRIQDLRDDIRARGPLKGGESDGKVWYKRSEARSPRRLAAIDSIVLHHMAFNRGNEVTAYRKVGAHYAVLADGQIAQLYDDLDYLNASNGFNRCSVAIEFAGNFPDLRYQWWKSQGRTIPDRCYVTPAQIGAGRCLLATLKARLPDLRYIYAHRQSSATRENDPGPDIWFSVAQWAVDNLGLTDRLPKTHVDRGQPIPDAWRAIRPQSASSARPATPARAPSVRTPEVLEAAPEEAELPDAPISEDEELEAWDLEIDRGTTVEEGEDLESFEDAGAAPGGGGAPVVPGPVVRRPTIGFEFDLNVGLSGEVFAARAADMPAGSTFPAEDVPLTDHVGRDVVGTLVDGFKVKRDGPRLEIATVPLALDNDAEFASLTRNVVRFARELEAARAKGRADQAITVSGIARHPVRFIHPRTSVGKLPLVIAARGKTSNRSWPADTGVWAAPQATITIPLEQVGNLIDAIAKSAGTGRGRALTGSGTQRLGVRSDFAVTAKKRVLADRARRLGTPLLDKSTVTASDYSDRLAGLLMLMTSYMLCGETLDTEDYELFAKSYLPINVKAPFWQLFAFALSDRERLVFREVYALKSENFFALAKDGATASDASNELFPPKVRVPDLDRFHTTRLTWGRLLTNTVFGIPLLVTKDNSVPKKNHAKGDEVLFAPISSIIPFDATKPLVALELRRIGFASHFVRFFEPVMKTVRNLAKGLNP